MYKLTRWEPQDRSGKVAWLLNEMNLPYEFQDLEHEVHSKSPEYRKLHPLGFVPVLMDLRKDRSLFESGAICMYLAEAHSEFNMMGAPGSDERMRCQQWLMFNFASFEPAVDLYYLLDPKDPELDAKKVECDVRVRPYVKAIDDALEPERFLCGDKFTIADICTSQTLFWLRRRPIMKDYPRAQAWLERMKARPAAIKSEIFNLPD